MISEIDTSSVVDETESTKVTTESQMAECSTELMRRPETTDGRDRRRDGQGELPIMPSVQRKLRRHVNKSSQFKSSQVK